MSKPNRWICPHCQKLLPPKAYMKRVREEAAPRAPRPKAEPREDAWTGLVGKALVDRVAPITVVQVLLCSDLPTDHGAQCRAARILIALGWVKARKMFGGGVRRWVYVRPGHEEVPDEVTISPLDARSTALYEAMSRWLLDVGDSPVSIDEILAGIRVEFSHANRIRVGRLLTSHFGRTRVGSTVGGARGFVYERYQQPPRL